MDLASPLLWVYAALTALIPGLLATWLGVGGCFLRIPMLIYLFNIPIKVAYSVNQATVALATIPGVIEHFRSRHVYVKGFVVASLSAMAGVSLGAYVVARYVPSNALRVIFGLACVAIGVYVLRKTIASRKALRRRVTVAEVRGLEHGYKLVALMFAAGFATGICGFGGGIYFVPAFIGLNYPTHVAVGTSSAQMLPVAGLGSAVLTANGYQNVAILVLVGVPTLIASWLGARLSARSPPWFLRLLYALAIMGAGSYVAIDSWLHM